MPDSVTRPVFNIVAESVEAAIDPGNKLTFLLDWELTLKCNLDCGYCARGLYGGHDNSRSHPDLLGCLETIDFMYEYVDAYMKHKSPWSRHVVLNIYGGESLYHPNIVEILEQVHARYETYRSNWTLTVTTTTNAVVSKKQILRIVDLIDEFTVSYHTESNAKQKQQVRDNLLLIKQHNRRLSCVILMHPNEENFTDNLSMIEFCKEYQIKHSPRQLDYEANDTRWNYKPYQVQWFDTYYQSRSTSKNTNLPTDSTVDLADVGRACCGGRQLTLNQNYKQRVFYTNNKFPDWYCSVNWFFLHVKQTTGEVFVNKDCKMNFDQSVGPIGTLENSSELIAKIKEQLDNNSMPVIQCKRSRCYCGLCAPKAQAKATFNQIMKKYLT